MTKSILKLVLVVSILFSASLMESCSKSKKSDSTTESTTEGTTASVYACPMHPEETGVEGDNCPKCDMPLEKVESSDESTDHDEDDEY